LRPKRHKTQRFSLVKTATKHPITNRFGRRYFAYII